MKKILFAALLFAVAVGASAQNETKAERRVRVGEETLGKWNHVRQLYLLGQATINFSYHEDVNRVFATKKYYGGKDMIGVGAGFGVGREETKLWGWRVMGAWNNNHGAKAGGDKTTTSPTGNVYKFHDAEIFGDATFNLTNWIKYDRRAKRVNSQILAGLGGAYSYNNHVFSNTQYDGTPHYQHVDGTGPVSHTSNFNHLVGAARVGANISYDVAPHFTIGAEARYHLYTDYFNGIRAQRFNDSRIDASLNLVWRLGKKTKKEEPAVVEEPVVVEETPVVEEQKPVVEEKPVEEWATRIDTTWYDEEVKTPRTQADSLEWNVYFPICKSDYNTAEAQLVEIGQFVKTHTDCKVSVRSYADKGTGNPKGNMGYSKARSEKTVKALVGAGVDSTIIDAKYYGDTVQPFAENDKNRVSIVKATGNSQVYDVTTVKKFRTKEVRYRVK